MQQLLLILHILICISLVALVLIQHGKGADIGATFGSGSSQTIFGSQGPASFLMKLTAFLAAVFFATTLALSYVTIHGYQRTNQFGLPGSETTQPTSLPEKTNPQTEPDPVSKQG